MPCRMASNTSEEIPDFGPGTMRPSPRLFGKIQGWWVTISRAPRLTAVSIAFSVKSTEMTAPRVFQAGSPAKRPVLSHFSEVPEGARRSSAA